jgi:galactose mutarotase-like enzyme
VAGLQALATTATTIAEIVRIGSTRWDLEVRPERGGRITSLRLDGEELLDQGIGVDQPTAKGFVEGGAWGWDEMVPNVEETDTLPDHGEAWRLPWEVLRADRAVVSMRARGRIAPWVLERTIGLGEDVRVSYRYRNAGSAPHAAFWCAHPLFRYESGMKIDLAEGASTKLFLPKGSTSSYRLAWRSGRRIEMGWDPKLTPFVSIWACNGDLGGYRQIAIEPAFGGYEGPDAETDVLAPGASLEWWLRIRAL